MSAVAFSLVSPAMKQRRRSRVEPQRQQRELMRGVALVRDHEIRLANGHWRQLAARDSRWVVTDGSASRSYGDLGRLATAELARLSRRKTATATIVRGDDRQTLRLRLERVTTPARESIGLVIVDDITTDGARADELARLRDALVRRDRLSALGRLASGIVHDLGNTLAALVARLQIAALSDDAGARRELRHIRAAADHMRGTLDRLHRFASEDRAPLTSVDLRGVLENAVTLIAPTLDGDGRRPAMRLEMAIPRRLPRVIGHPADLQSVFINLLLNARDAMPKGGTVIIAARVAGNRVVVSVRDQGTGVAPEHLPRLFEPFFTTKRGASRAGLGLSLAYGVVNAADGHITADNHPDGGLEITIGLRLARPRRKRR